MFKAYKNFGFNSHASDTAGNGIISATTFMETFMRPTFCKIYEQKSVLINTLINNAKIWQGEGLNKRKVQGIFELKKRGINQWKRLSMS